MADWAESLCVIAGDWRAGARSIYQRSGCSATSDALVHDCRRLVIGDFGRPASFSHPLMIGSKSLAPALATGNSVALKPSELTPLTALRLGEAALEGRPSSRRSQCRSGTEPRRAIAPAGRRFFVQQKLYDALVDRLATAMISASTPVQARTVPRGPATCSSISVNSAPAGNGHALRQARLRILKYSRQDTEA